MVKKFLKLCLWLTLVAVLAISLSGCNLSGNQDLQRQIDILNAKLIEQEQKISDLENNISELESENKGLENKITKLENENKALLNRVGQLESMGTGAFFTLREAYQQGWITQEDLKSIAYYHNQGFDLIGDWDNWKLVPSEYVPIPKLPLNKTTEDRIVSEFCSYINCPATQHLGHIYYNFYGTYNGYIVVMPNGLCYDYLDFYEYHKIGDVGFYLISEPGIHVWKIVDTK